MMIKENNVDNTFLRIMKDNGLGELEDIKAIKNITIKLKQKSTSLHWYHFKHENNQL